MIGGTNSNTDIHKYRQDPPDILICTPLRLIEHLVNKSIPSSPSLIEISPPLIDKRKNQIWPLLHMLTLTLWSFSCWTKRTPSSKWGSEKMLPKSKATYPRVRVRYLHKVPATTYSLLNCSFTQYMLAATYYLICSVLQRAMFTATMTQDVTDFGGLRDSFAAVSTLTGEQALSVGSVVEVCFRFYYLILPVCMNIYSISFI